MVKLEEINKREVLDELSILFAEYEDALKNNNVPVLQEFFWPSELAIRFGVTEQLYGANAIDVFRKNRVINFKDRRSLRQDIVALGHDLGIATLEFSVNAAGKIKHGRQTQVWVRIEDLGWRIVSAHVSHKVEPRLETDQEIAADYNKSAADLLGIFIDPKFSVEVQQNMMVMAAVAAPLMELDLPDSIELAPEFKP